MNTKKIILYSLLTVCILAVGIFAFLLVRELTIERQSQSFFENLAAGIETRPRVPGQIITGGAGSSDTGSDSDPGSPDDKLPGENIEEEWVPYVDFEALSIELPGIVGWLLLDESPINFPVMQYRNNDFFLRHLPDGTPHKNGSIFLDYRNENDFSDNSILIFGHMTRNDDMFGILREYRNQEFYDANPIMYLFTPEKDYTILLFAAHLAHSQNDHPPLHFSEDGLLAYADGLKRASFFKSDVTVEAGDRLVSLCTCAYDFDEARLILTGVLIG